MTISVATVIIFTLLGIFIPWLINFFFFGIEFALFQYALLVLFGIATGIASEILSDILADWIGKLEKLSGGSGNVGCTIHLIIGIGFMILFIASAGYQAFILYNQDQQQTDDGERLQDEIERLEDENNDLQLTIETISPEVSSKTIPLDFTQIHRGVLDKDNIDSEQLQFSIGNSLNGDYFEFTVSSTDTNVNDLDVKLWELVSKEGTRQPMDSRAISPNPNNGNLSRYIYQLDAGFYEIDVSLDNPDIQESVSYELNVISHVIGCEMQVINSPGQGVPVLENLEVGSEYINNNSTRPMYDDVFVNAINLSPDGQYYEINYIGRNGQMTGWVNRQYLRCDTACTFPSCEPS